MSVARKRMTLGSFAICLPAGCSGVEPITTGEARSAIVSFSRFKLAIYAGWVTTSAVLTVAVVQT